MPLSSLRHALGDISPAPELVVPSRAPIPTLAGMNAEPIAHDAHINRYRSIFISDLHLGTRGCKAEFLLDFLKFNEADNIYLVGDIIDCWRL